MVKISVSETYKHYDIVIDGEIISDDTYLTTAFDILKRTMIETIHGFEEEDLCRIKSEESDEGYYHIYLEFDSEDESGRFGKLDYERISGGIDACLVGFGLLQEAFPADISTY